MQKQDDTQQAAELRQAFLRHLPKRLDTLRKRGLLTLRSRETAEFLIAHIGWIADDRIERCCGSGVKKIARRNPGLEAFRLQALAS